MVSSVHEPLPVDDLLLSHLVERGCPVRVWVRELPLSLQRTESKFGFGAIGYQPLACFLIYLSGRFNDRIRRHNHLVRVLLSAVH